MFLMEYETHKYNNMCWDFLICKLSCNFSSLDFNGKYKLDLYFKETVLYTYLLSQTSYFHVV